MTADDEAQIQENSEGIAGAAGRHAVAGFSAEDHHKGRADRDAIPNSPDDRGGRLRAAAECRQGEVEDPTVWRQLNIGR